MLYRSMGVDDTMRQSLLAEPALLRFLMRSQHDERDTTIYPRPLLSCTSACNLLNHL